MVGLRTQEDDKFVKFFSLVQDIARGSNSVFFLDSGEGNEIITSEFEGEDLFGWLIPNEKSEEFKREYLSFDVSEKWDPFFKFANWYPDGNDIKIVFENGRG